MAYNHYGRESFWSRVGYWLTRGVTWPFRTEENRSIAWKVAKPSIAVLLLAYFAFLFYNFAIFWGREIHYPQKILQSETLVDDPAPASGDQEIVSPSEACIPSRMVDMQIHLIDLLVNQNAWVPSHPVYKFGLLGVVGWEDTPFFDDKAEEQLGMLNVLRRVAIEMIDSLGRVRGTSAAVEELQAAHSLLRINEYAWYVNSPFNANVNTISPSAADSFRQAIPLYQAYNQDVARCQAVFDTRGDNLRQLLSRMTALLGATTTALAERTRAWTYDPETDRFVAADGNNWGWFDLRADNFVHRARGEMYALHGLMQAARADFSEVLEENNVDEIWDKMERAIAEAASMDPPIVSNGSQNSIFMPDHLGKMAELIFRARAAMTEVRDVLLA